MTTPMEAWPITGFVRLLGTVFGPPEVWGPGGAGWWPDAPLWKLSGLFDLTADQSVQAGVADLEQAMAEHGNDHLVIYGISQGSLIATVEKRKLAEQYPVGTEAPDIDFVMQGTSICPTGAFMPGSRACTFLSSIGRSTAPRRPTPSSTRSSSTGSTTVRRFPVVSDQSHRRL